jgi:cytochrome b
MRRNRVNKVRIWDLPTRVFHWSLVLCLVGLVVTGKIGGEAMAWHFRLGYAVLSLLLFRLVWGFMGGHWSRFTVFLVGPTGILRYLQGHNTSPSAGHNPLGALSVLALLGFALLQVATGLISDDEIATAGPLAKMVPGAWVARATYYHNAIGQYVLYALVALHIGAMCFYYFKRKDNLVPAMWHGDKELAAPQQCARDDGTSRLLALVVFAICAGLVAGLVQWAG